MRQKRYRQRKKLMNANHRCFRTEHRLTLTKGAELVDEWDVASAFAKHIERKRDIVSLWSHIPENRNSPFAAVSRFFDRRGTRFLLSTQVAADGVLQTYVVLGHHHSDDPTLVSNLDICDLRCTDVTLRISDIPSDGLKVA